MTRTLAIALALAPWVASGCILEDNPDFADTAGGTGTESTTGSGTEATGPSTSGSGTSGTGTDSGTDTDTGPPMPVGPGCDEPECPEIHIGLEQLDCERMVDGSMVQDCDHVGPWALRIAAADAEVRGGARILMHDRGGTPAEFIGVVNLPGHTTLSAATGTLGRNVRVVFTSDPQDEIDVLRLTGDDIYLHDFMLLAESGARYGVRFRTDDDEAGTETGEHLIENLEIVAIVPEEAGGNSIQAPFKSVGPNTVIRNCHIWGFWESGVLLRFAPGFRFYNNTWIGFQRLGTLFNAASTSDIEISNNVFVSLTREATTVVQGDVATSDLKVAGNLIERFGAIGIGLPDDPSIEITNNVVGEVPLLYPSDPRVLMDASVAADPTAANGGRSFDDIDISEAAQVLPGAFQQRSSVAGPRSTTTTAGSGQCGSQQCDVDSSLENALQMAAWRTWPGGTLELHPATFEQVVITWPIDVLGTDYEQVRIQRDSPSGFLGTHNTWAAHTAVVRVNPDMDAPVRIADLTIESAPGQEGLVVEGTTTTGPPSPHVLERLQIVDRGDTDMELADAGAWLGHNSILRDSLIVGGFRRCVMHGVRESPARPTPNTTNFVYNLTCRLTETNADEDLRVMAVAGATNSQWFNIAVDMAEPGTIFFAQRRVSTSDPDLDTDPLALDHPSSFDATNWVIRNGDTNFDGYTASDGNYGLSNIDPVADADPFFVSATDSHLDAGAAGLDSGVQPSTIDPMLGLGTALDGVDRAGATIDHGAFEQGN